MRKELSDKLEKELAEVELELKRTNEFLSEKALAGESRIRNQRIAIICITIVMLASLIANVLMFREISRYRKVAETTVEETYDINQNAGDNGTINNVDGDQYNDDSVHNE